MSKKVDLTGIDMPKRIYRSLNDRTIMAESPAILCNLISRASPDLLVEPLEAEHLLTTTRLHILSLQKLEKHLVEQLKNIEE